MSSRAGVAEGRGQHDGAEHRVGVRGRVAEEHEHRLAGEGADGRAVLADEPPSISWNDSRTASSSSGPDGAGDGGEAPELPRRAPRSRGGAARAASGRRTRTSPRPAAARGSGGARGGARARGAGRGPAPPASGSACVSSAFWSSRVSWYCFRRTSDRTRARSSACSRGWRRKSSAPGLRARGSAPPRVRPSPSRRGGGWCAGRRGCGGRPRSRSCPACSRRGARCRSSLAAIASRASAPVDAICTTKPAGREHGVEQAPVGGRRRRRRGRGSAGRPSDESASTGASLTPAGGVRRGGGRVPAG